MLKKRTQIHSGSRPLSAGSAKYAGSGFNLDLYDIRAESDATDQHREWDIHSYLSARSGTASHLNCGQFCNIDNLDIEYTPQAITLHNITLRSGRSDISLQGSLADYKHPTAKNPLKIRLDSEIGTLDINELARNYKSHQSAHVTAVSEKTATADTSSSTALSIPRCIDARIGIKAKETLYTNLRLFDLGTGINICNGEAHIENLHASSDFGSAHLNLSCNTQDIQKMTLNTEISLDSINITRFFNAFHKLEEMMPVMKNLHGIVSAKASGGFHIFPNMDIDIPSVQALVGIHGRDLRIHQSKFVRRITRMLLIPHSDDLNIHDMTVKAVVHDNMLELYPFIFQFAQYKIAMLGHNNFAGDLYYHIAVLHSPLPFRFGINIKGNMDRPELRFGGAGYNEKDAMKITSIVENKRINLVKEMGVYLNKFIDKAAEHRGD